MKAKQRTVAIIFMVSLLAISTMFCNYAPAELFGPTRTPTPTQTLTPTPTYTPTPTNTPSPTPTFTPTPTASSTPKPGLGVSRQKFQTSFEGAGFTFKPLNDGLQGQFSSDKMLCIITLSGPAEDLSGASIWFMLALDQNATLQFLNLFFQDAFPVKTDRDIAMDWFINKSGMKTGATEAKISIGHTQLSWVKGSMGDVDITVKVP